ncbi:TlyA family RNA methyltransferase [Trichothermofontia sp.]
MSKQRLDLLLVERGLCTSRQQAQRCIRAGAVRVDRVVVDKPGTEVIPSALIELQQRPPYVSRGGEKLAKALAEFAISVGDRICLDGGISTGGFTDCLLQAGAKQVYGVDVGYGQLDWQLRTDPRVIVHERTNLRHLQPETLYPDGAPTADLAVVDVSFISLGKILPALWRLLRSPREVILLVKPQFEVGRNQVGKKGVVRNPDDQVGAIVQVLTAATGSSFRQLSKQSSGPSSELSSELSSEPSTAHSPVSWVFCGLTWSPILGPAGNIEYLLWLREGEGDRAPQDSWTPAMVAQVVAAAHAELRP